MHLHLQTLYLFSYFDNNSTNNVQGAAIDCRTFLARLSRRRSQVELFLIGLPRRFVLRVNVQSIGQRVHLLYHREPTDSMFRMSHDNCVFPFSSPPLYVFPLLKIFKFFFFFFNNLIVEWKDLHRCLSMNVRNTFLIILKSMLIVWFSLFFPLLNSVVQKYHLILLSPKDFN